MLSVAVPPVSVTTTFVAPAVPAGVVQVMVVEFTTEQPVAAVPPIVTVAPVVKLVPVRVTPVPPASAPMLGEMLVKVGTAMLVKPPAKAALVPATMTITSLAPADIAGVVQVMVVLLTTVQPVAAVPPRVTVAPVAKLVPDRVIVVPPAALPLVGEMPVKVGAAAGAVGADGMLASGTVLCTVERTSRPRIQLVVSAVL